MMPRLPDDVLDPRFYDHLGEIPEDLFDERLYWSVELVERYAREWAVELAGLLGLERAVERAGDAGATAGAVVASLELDPEVRSAASWILEQLAAAGLLYAAGPPTTPEHRRFSSAGPLRPSHRPRIREAALEQSPGNEPFLDLLDAAGEVLPRLAAGETTGEAALLGAAGIGRWIRYFSNDNPVYALNNRLAALAAAARLPRPSRTGAATGSGAELLEVGAGAGSASAALLEAMEERNLLDRIGRFRITEPAAMLRRRAERTLPRRFPLSESGGELVFADLDVDRPWAEQGVEPESLDLVYGVNVLHVARNLGASLAQAFDALAPGGWLVAGECLRPLPGQPVAAELPFLLLEGFRDV
ncbi:MAG: hypothetical protein PVG07_12980, partial [Acidobacteriota bacterium]